jgi:ribonuclease VapC
MSDETSSSIVVDTSAIVGIYMREPDAERLATKVVLSDHAVFPAPCLVEFLSLHRLGGDRLFWIEAFIEKYRLTVVPLTTAVAWDAGQAALRFGRGSGHAAKLNFGDCMSYAFARHLDAPLLFKGNDFIHTDITPALTVQI